MLSEAFLVRALIALAVIFALSLAYLLGHGAWLVLARRRTHRYMERGRAALRGLVTADVVTEDDLATIRALPPRIRARLFVELSRNFGGSVRDRLSEIAAEVGTLGPIERMLRSRFWWRRLRAVRTLSALDASEAVILERLQDPHPAVRAQVAEWAADHPSPAILRALLEMLSRSDALYRFTVQDSLLRAGDAAAEPLAAYLEGRSGAEVIPALEVAATLAHPALTPPAHSLSHDPDPPVRARAAAVLGSVGGEEAIARLLDLMGDPEAEVRASAVRALARLGHWPAATAIAQRLRDPVWEVRRAAGLGLLALGSPGLLLLRRYRTDEDRFAADMATQVLDLPSATEARV